MKKKIHMDCFEISSKVLKHISLLGSFVKVNMVFCVKMKADLYVYCEYRPLNLLIR